MSRTLPLISFCLLLIIIVVSVFIWWPKYQDFQNLKLQLQAKEKTLSEKQEYFSKLDGFAKKLEGYKESFDKVDTALPEEVSEPDLFNFVETASSSSGLLLKKIGSSRISVPSADEEGKTKDIQDITFSVTLSGSYQGLKDFLSNLYQNSRLIEVDSMKFSSPKEAATPYEFNLVLLAHYLANPTQSQ